MEGGGCLYVFRKMTLARTRGKATDTKGGSSRMMDKEAWNRAEESHKGMGFNFAGLPGLEGNASGAGAARLLFLFLFSTNSPLPYPESKQVNKQSTSRG